MRALLCSFALACGALSFAAAPVAAQELEGEGVPSTPAITKVIRRYWYAPAVGWYVRHELIATGPHIDQRNEYVAVKIARGEKRSEAK